MSAPDRNIPDVVRRAQMEAADPQASAWVSANAGSGKTHVLVQRVIALLLRGVDPAKILCITFTKAAAANMANRVFGELRKWTSLDDDALDRAIRSIANDTPDAKLRALARRLFATALETPGGLKVQTIHAFCTRLLQQFPFEANVAARFSVLDDTTQRNLLEEIGLTVLLDAAARPESPAGRALAVAIMAAADQTFQDAVNATIGKRDTLEKWIEGAGGLEAAIAGLSRALGIEPATTQEEVEREIVNGPVFPQSEWAAVAALCRESTARDQDQCERLTEAAREAGTEQITAYFKVFIDGKLKPRPSILTQGLAKKHPALAQKLIEEQARVVALREKRNAVICRDRTAALVTIAWEIVARHRTEKERRGLLDYDDLIDKTEAMLARVESSWVHYKLDLGIDHVLIDEAQDTSPRQWEIIRHLVAEFFAGAGARAVRRTIFAVGDEKQSIFSFQGAAPQSFDEMRRFFLDTHKKAELAFIARDFTHSFRSGANVLGAVDDVFRAQEVFVSVTSDEGGVRPHIALEDKAPGFVEIWPLIEPDKREPVEPWDAPFDATSETTPRMKLARRLALNVAHWRQQGVRPGDVLVLVRQRGPLFEAIIRALKNADVPVAGADRLVLTEHIAVMDLLALADALLLPADDLALATVLKSPLFGLSEEQLFALAWQRKSSLRAALRAKAADPEFAEAAARLDKLAAEARRDTQFTFYARLLGAGRGRASFLARLGPEAADPLDEFLQLALDFERRETPSLQGFVQWLRTANAEIKRDMEMARDEVRVMTVHGAKGLEARVVVLADTTTPPAGPTLHQPRVFALPPQNAPPGAPDRLAWAPRKDDDTAPVAQARATALDAAEDEYRRLLYVAMTRAAERLVVCGSVGVQRIPDGCWYRLITNALTPHCVQEDADDGDGKVLRYRKFAGAGRAEPTGEAAATQAAPALPAWLRSNAATETRLSVPMSPSSAHDDATIVHRFSGGETERRKALLRGSLMHRLLEALPEIPRKARAQAAQRHLDRAATDFTAEERAAMHKQVHRVLDDPRFLALFSPGSRSEVPIVGRIAREGKPALAVSGLVDRLAVTPDCVLIADYKTNRPPPRRTEDVPAYVAQLALYRAVLARLYPGKPVRAALLWTEVPDLMEVSAEALDAAFARVLAS